MGVSGARCQVPGARCPGICPVPGTWHLVPVLAARLSHAGDHPGQRQLAEADAAETEAAQERTRPAATAAAIVLAHLELRLPLALLDHGLTSHLCLSWLLVTGSWLLADG